MTDDDGPGPFPSAATVLIAGGGPVGLATAIELDHHGVSSLVVERRRSVSWLRPRAKTTSARTMEHFRRWGLAETLRARAPLPVGWSDRAVFCTTLLGREVTRFDRCFGLDLTGSDLVAEAGQQVAQPLVEQVLRDAVAASAHARLRVGAEVTGVVAADGGVLVDLVTDTGDAHRVHADYVVGCEGARSVVRDALGARYEGSDDSRPNFNAVFRAPGLAERVPHGAAVHYWVIDAGQPGLVGRLDLDGTWWCIAQGVDPAAGPVDAERIVHNLVGDETPVEILATDSWRARMLLADRYRSGRLFIAGDAAHQNPPWGGHGFNTGIGDAVNLGWKLAAVVNGWAAEDLLDSYESERRPVAARTIDEAARNMSTLAPELGDPRLGGTNDEFRRARPGAAEAIQRTKDSEFHSLPLTLGYTYGDSPIVAGGALGGSPAPPGSPGRPAHPPLVLARRLLYDHLGREHTLVGDLASPAARRLAAAAAAHGLPLEQLALGESDRRRLLGAPLALVRPDQHIAWRGRAPADPEDLILRVSGRRPAPGGGPGD